MTGADGQRCQPQPRLVANQAEMLQRLALAGAGVARLPEFAIAEDLTRGALVRLFPDDQDQEEELLYVLHHARRHVIPSCAEQDS